MIGRIAAFWTLWWAIVLARPVQDGVHALGLWAEIAACCTLCALSAWAHWPRKEYIQ